MGSKAFCACACVCMQALMFWSGERQNVINTRALKLLFRKLSIFFCFRLVPVTLMQAITPLRMLDALFHFRHFLYQSWNQKWWCICMPMDKLSSEVCVLFFVLTNKNSLEMSATDNPSTYCRQDFLIHFPFHFTISPFHIKAVRLKSAVSTQFSTNLTVPLKIRSHDATT